MFLGKRNSRSSNFRFCAHKKSLRNFSSPKKCFLPDGTTMYSDCEKKPASTKLGTSDKSPQTGDTSNLALWIALLFVSGGAAIGTTVVSRKKKYNK